MVEGFVSEKGDKKSPHFVRHVILRECNDRRISLHTICHSEGTQ